LESPSGCTHHQVLNHSKQIKNDKHMGLELERDLEVVFQKNKIEANYHSSSSYVFCIAPLLTTFKEHL